MAKEFIEQGGFVRLSHDKLQVVLCFLGDGAYACLSQIGLKTYRTQGQNKSKNVLRLEPISKLKNRMPRIVWKENIQDVIKYSHEKSVVRRLGRLLAA